MLSPQKVTDQTLLKSQFAQRQRDMASSLAECPCLNMFSISDRTMSYSADLIFITKIGGVPPDNLAGTLTLFGRERLIKHRKNGIVKYWLFEHIQKKPLKSVCGFTGTW